MNDHELIQRVLNGERHIYAELVRKHHQNIISLCLSLLKNPSEADDAAQDSFIKAYRGLSNFRKESEFSTWVYRIAYRTCLDMLRKRARQKHESWEELLEQRGEEVHQLLSSSVDPEKALENKDLVFRILETMSSDYRHILVLREIQGLSYEEIAEVMNCTLDAVKARLRRARLDLQKKVAPLLSPNTQIDHSSSNMTRSLL